jgi:hypothetical protein
MQTDIRYWFPTEELADYVESRGFNFDRKRIKKEYEVNKLMALITIKYFR